MSFLLDYLKDHSKDSLFFESDLSFLPSEELLKDSKKVVSRIIEGIYHQENIMIYGHDDADGITSTYILDSYLRIIGSKKHQCYIPNRMIENHGVSQNLIDACLEQKTDLLIIVDNGITSVEGINKLNSFGIIVIIIDHHIVPVIHPEAYAIVNPKQSDCEYPDKMLAGVGLVWLIIRFLSREMKISLPRSLQFWVAVGSIADRVPLTGINRLIVRNLLINWDNCINDNVIRLFLSKFKPVKTLADKIDFIQWLVKYFYTGREEKGQHKCFSLLKKPDQFEQIFHSINQSIIESNRSYDKSVEELYTKIIQPIDQYLSGSDIDLNSGIIVCNNDFGMISLIVVNTDKNCDYSQIGRLTSILCRYYNLPVMYLCEKSEGNLACEARGTEWFNWLDCFNFCSKNLLQFGGHAKAAGFVMKFENFDLLVKDYQIYFLKYSNKQPEILQYKSQLEISFKTGIFKEFEEFYEMMMPFGEQNHSPIMSLKDYQINEDDIYYFEQVKRLSVEDIIFEKKHREFMNLFDKKNKPCLDLVAQLNDKGKIQVIDYKFKGQVC